MCSWRCARRGWTDEALLDQSEVEERGRGVECFVVAETKERRKTDGLQKGNIGFNSKMNDDYGDDDVKRIVSYDISGGKLGARSVDDLPAASARRLRRGLARRAQSDEKTAQKAREHDQEPRVT